MSCAGRLLCPGLLEARMRAPVTKGKGVYPAFIAPWFRKYMPSKKNNGPSSLLGHDFIESSGGVIAAANLT